MIFCAKLISVLTDIELIKSLPFFPQTSETFTIIDGSVDDAKMAELESRLAAQTTEMERLKVSRRSVQQGITEITNIQVQPSSSPAPFTCHRPLVTFPPFMLQEEAKVSSGSRADLEQQLASSTSTVAILQTEKAKLQTDVQESKKEQDDLLMLLADQDQKINSLKLRLKELGETVNHHFSTLLSSSGVLTHV